MVACSGGITAATRRRGYTGNRLARDRMPSVDSPAEEESLAPATTNAAHRETPRPQRSESRQRTALVAVRLLPQERDVIAQSARSRGVTLSEFIRASAMGSAGMSASEVDFDSPGCGLPG